MKVPLSRWPGGHRSAAVVLVCAVCVSGCRASVDDGGPGAVGPTVPVGTEVGVPGSGTIVSEEREASGFTRVVFDGEGDVRIAPGPEASVEVEADDNLLVYLETLVDEDILRIQTADGVDIAPSRPPEYRITMPEVGEVELSGVGSIEVESAQSEILSITLSGVGDITVASVDVGLLLFDFNGVGSVSVDGRVDDQRGVVAGQCLYRAADLKSTRAMLQASGGGAATIWVVDQLEVSAIDSASVEYYGSPDVTQEVADLATVTGLGER